MADAADDSTEWEYEYDAEEMGTYYITLDLTSHLIPSQRGKRKNTTATKPDKEASSKRSDEVAEQLAKEAATTNDDTSHQDQPKHPIQIIDLESDNPLIAYNKQLYSCHWATDVGTSVFLSAPSMDVESNSLRSFKNFELVGTTSARLMGVPVKVRPRLVPLSAARRNDNYNSEDVSTLADGEIIRSSAEHGLQIDLPDTASADKVSQARFLERLSTLKRQRGEMDHVPVKPIKQYTRPENWEQEREDWLAQERAEKARKQAEAGPNEAEEQSQDTIRESQSAQPGAETQMSLTELFKSRKRVRRYTSADRGRGRGRGRGKRPAHRPSRLRLDEEKMDEIETEDSRAESEMAATPSEVAESSRQSATPAAEDETQDTHIVD
ncbi:hypothetical protein MBLNU457_7529t1 [Dothideomycetes sp. NU457]